MLNFAPYEITRVDSLQWNRTANIRVMKEMIGSREQVVSAGCERASFLVASFDVQHKHKHTP